MKTTTTTPAAAKERPPTPADAYLIVNAACPRCNGPVYWSAARNLHCLRCPAPNRLPGRAAG